MDLGDRMKLFEGLHSTTLCPGIPAMCRLDGARFHNFTKGLARPYDERLSNLMVETTKFLVKLTNAKMGYTQSDEISLCLYSDNPDSQIYFDGKIYKMTSVLAAEASAFFNKNLSIYIPEKSESMPVFDCRVWNVPSKTEATNAFLWRELDATKNSISMAARTFYSHNELHNKNGSEMQELLFQKGINWNDYPAFFKRGTYVQNRKREIKFTADELDKLPENHEARTNPDLTILRSQILILDLPPLLKVINRDAVIFDSADPVCESA